MFLHWKKRGAYELEALPSSLTQVGFERFSWSSSLDVIHDLRGKPGISRITWLSGGFMFACAFSHIFHKSDGLVEARRQKCVTLLYGRIWFTLAPSWKKIHFHCTVPQWKARSDLAWRQPHMSEKRREKRMRPAPQIKYLSLKRGTAELKCFPVSSQGFLWRGAGALTFRWAARLMPLVRGKW